MPTHMPLQETFRHSQAGLAQSLVGSLLLSPGFWCTHFVCVLQESLFPPGLWKFCNQILLSFKVSFPGDSQSLCQIPRLGSLMGAQNLHKSMRTSSLVLLFSSVWVTHLLGMGFNFNCDFCTPPTVLLQLPLCPWTWDIFFCWVLVSSCQWSFSSQL